MKDTNLMFTAKKVTTTEESTVVTLNKTDAEGLQIAVDVTAVEGTNPTCAIVVHSLANAVLFTFPTITAVGHYVGIIKTAEASVHLSYTIGGTDTPGFTIQAGVVSGFNFYDSI